MRVRVYLYSNDRDIVGEFKAKLVRSALYAYDAYLSTNVVNHTRVKRGKIIKRIDVDVDENIDAIVKHYSMFEEVPISDLVVEAVRWYTDKTVNSANSLAEWDAHINLLEKYDSYDDMPIELAQWSEEFIEHLTPTQWLAFIKYYKQKAGVNSGEK